ncbi:hypothetical protein [Candidatus Burkholderia verschuerenii]|uniref:hypothetical protein n=1 Tax=Candidatus Burkholderia verschuerenii TaxID=242163 RepID=UPI001E44B89C|nr:hypothetical protein [Candidatus Burkholderia verschuerenii]
MNIVMVLLNVPIVLVGQKLVYRAQEDYRTRRIGRFVSEEIGVRTEYWTGDAPSSGDFGEVIGFGFFVALFYSVTAFPAEGLLSLRRQRK